MNSARIFPKLLSLCFLVVPPCWAAERAGGLAFGSLRFATGLLFLLSHGSHTFRVASFFANKPLTSGVQKWVALIVACALGMLSREDAFH